MKTYKLVFSPNYDLDIRKTVIVEDMQNELEAQDYAAMFFDANYIHKTVEVVKDEKTKAFIEVKK